MANHNVEITKPDGSTSLALDENVLRDTAEEYLKDMGDPPKGWFYRIVNLKVKPSRRYDSLLVGVDFSTDEPKIVDQRRVGMLLNDGKRLTRKQARKAMRTQGATHFISKKVPKEKVNGSE